MNKNFKWYTVLILSVIGLVVYAGYFFGLGDRINPFGPVRPQQPVGTTPAGQTNKLQIPPLLENKSSEPGKAEFDLFVQYGKKTFFQGTEADTLGYNGDYLGPVIRVERGDEVQINVFNELKEATTVHWHGLEVDGDNDGGPHQVIDPGASWKPYFTIDQPAATLWFHPHLMDKTGEQVYKGLAGLFYIDDENSKSLELPKEYGVNDIPLIIQDKRFTSQGDIPYNLSMSDLMTGFMGDQVIINGTINPLLEVKNEVIRLRLLNGSNARSYQFSLSDTLPFYQIASDGGFLEESIKMTNLRLAPGERAEILVDLTDYEVGDELFFRDINSNLMTVKINDQATQSIKIPRNLAKIDEYSRSDILRTRTFVMSGMGPMVSINGKQMDMNRIDEEVNLNELEEWIIRNDSSGMGGRRGMGGMGMMNTSPHPFHIHGVQFRVVERNGRTPPQNERGWKDTVMLEDGEEVRILVQFRKKGVFMYHCHILEHEDAGMMGQFLVK